MFIIGHLLVHGIVGLNGGHGLGLVVVEAGHLDEGDAEEDILLGLLALEINTVGDLPQELLGQGGATLGVGHQPDVAGPGLEVVDALGELGVPLGHVDVAGLGHDHVDEDGGRAGPQLGPLCPLLLGDWSPGEGVARGGHFVGVKDLKR